MINALLTFFEKSTIESRPILQASKKEFFKIRSSGGYPEINNSEKTNKSVSIAFLSDKACMTLSTLPWISPTILFNCATTIFIFISVIIHSLLKPYGQLKD